MTRDQIDLDALGREWQAALAAYEKLDVKPSLLDFLKYWEEDWDYDDYKATEADLLAGLHG